MLSVVAADPVLAHETLARFALRRGRIDAAREHAEIAVRQAPRRISLLMLLAEVSQKASRPAEQLMWLDRAEEEIATRAASPLESLQLQRGNALDSLGRFAEAETAYRTEATQFPRNVEAWRGLATFLSRHGRNEEAEALLAEAARTNDSAAMKALNRQVLEGRVKTK